MNWVKGMFASVGVVAMLVMIGIYICLGGICLHFDITTIQSLTHHAIANGFGFWILCLILGLFLGGISVPVAIILWLVSMFS